MPTSNGSKPPTPSYLKYSGLAVQMFVIMLLGFWIGSKIDDHLQLEKPYWSVGLCFMFLIGIFYKIIRDSNAGRL